MYSKSVFLREGDPPVWSKQRYIERFYKESEALEDQSDSHEQPRESKLRKKMPVDYKHRQRKHKFGS